MDDVKIFDRALGSNEVTALFWDSAAPAPAPTNFIATAASGQVDLNWSSVRGTIVYDVKRSTNPGGPFFSFTNLADTSCVDINVTNGTTYYYVVAAVNSLGDGTNSIIATATPSLAAALKIWFAADALNGLANGAPVSDWPDQSGNGNDAVQSNFAQRPLFLTNAINGLPAIRFNSGDSNYLAFVCPVQDDFTIFCVFRTTQGIGTDEKFYSGAGLVSGEVSGGANDFAVCINTNGEVLAGTGNPDTTAVSAGGYNDDKPHLLTFERKKNSGKISLYLDGSLVATATGGTQSLTAPTQLVLGAQQTLLNFFDGDIAEVKIFNSVLSDSNRQLEESALECKYGIDGVIVTPPTPTNLNGAAGSDGILLNWSASDGAVAYVLSSATNLNGLFKPVAFGITGNDYVDTSAVSGRTNYYEIAAMNGCRVSANSAPVAVYLANPKLTVGGASENSLKISWPVSANGWKLYFTTNLNPPITWWPVTNSVDDSNGENRVSVPVSSGTKFFQLFAP